jgi:hypothetical protein
MLSLECALPVTGSNTLAIVVLATTAMLTGFALRRLGRRRSAAVVALVCLTAASMTASQRRADAQTETCTAATTTTTNTTSTTNTAPGIGSLVSGTYRQTGALGGSGTLADALITLVEPGPDGVLGTNDDTQRTTTTATDGRYSFDHVPAGPHRVTTSALPIIAEDFTFHVHPTATTDFQGRWGVLSPAGTTATITMAGVDNSFGTPDDIVVTAVTDLNGNFMASIPGPLIFGLFTIVASSIPGHVAVSTSGNICANCTGSQTVTAWTRNTNAIDITVAVGTDQGAIDFLATTTNSGFDSIAA